MQDLKEKTIRGGLASVCALGAGFLLRLVALMILARFLGPKDFGLMGMVTAFTGVLGLFRDFGLSAAAFSVRLLQNSRFQHYSGSTCCLERFSDWSH
jgi:O-antigen/teichoic acid export membrane protein